MHRKTNEQRKAETRQRLLKAAAKIFARRGFHAASVDEIAGEAGYSTGALYHQFKGKDDLFLALMEEHVAERIREYTDAFELAEGPDRQARAGADRWVAFLRDDPDFFPLYIEFWAVAVREPDLRPKFAARLAAFRETFARFIEAGAREAGFDIDADTALRLGTIVNAMGNGMALERLADPGAVPDELFGDALTMIFQGLAALARETQGASS